MGHRADESFFREKKPWSERKDEILRCYLPAYLPKIATQRAPILIVDAFAGPGGFDDGKPGSPLIVCQCVQEALSHKLSVPVSVLFIEKIRVLFDRLQTVIQDYAFAKAVHGEFGDFVQAIEKQARDHSVFLYVDPFTVKGLDWEQLDSILRHLEMSRVSIELLLNFNARSFVRWALAAQKLSVPSPDPSIEDVDEIDAHMDTPPSIERLNAIVGGEWWQEITRSSEDFPTKVQQVTKGLCRRLNARFRYVCCHDVKALPHHTVPKYYLVFGSRHPDALLLMNDQMVKSRDKLAELAKPNEDTLFEMRSEELVPDTAKLSEIVTRHASETKRRYSVILDVIQEHFCQFSTPQIRKCIKQLLEEGKMKSETGKPRINDRVKIWTVK